jgi:hypothetical protein
MPVVVPPEAFDFWLDCRNVDAETAAALLNPAPEELLEGYEISTAVNRVVNDSAQLLDPAPARDPAMPEPAASPPPKRSRKPKEDERQSSLF